MLTIRGSSGCAQGADEVAAEQHRPDRVDADLVENEVGVELEDIALVVGYAEGASVDAGVVDQHVEWRVTDGGGELLDRRLLAHIDGVDVGSQRPQFGRVGGLPAAGPHLVATRRVDTGQLEPEAAVGAGDDNALGGHANPRSRRASAERDDPVRWVDANPEHPHSTRPLDAVRRVVEEHDLAGWQAELVRRQSGRPAARAWGSRSRRRR